MSYERALEAAGVDVVVFEKFGSYQGDWLAKVRHDGHLGWIHGYYGSCSGCDAFEGEFGFTSHECGDDDWYDPLWDESGFKDDCKTCQDIKERLRVFGEGYIESICTQEEIEAECKKNIEWDLDADEMLKFVEANKI